MIENLKRTRCGGCGGDMFRLFTAEAETRIVVECEKCKATSYIQPEPARLEIEFGEDSDGCITVWD
ncbi:hypothetical protein [Paraburkholderia megapolitana]|uniref:hypothetical protein n=1 Tax=Paraburkholderia megapolitana TaxID=420953 RepID=UPI0038BB787D